MELDKHRLYPLRSHPTYGFYTGKLPSGQQLIVGCFYNAILAIFFDAEGQFLRSHRQQVIASTRVPLDFTPEEAQQFQEALARYRHQMQFQETPIEVRAFFVEGVGIDELPSHYQDFLEDPTIFPPSDHEDVRRDIERWIARGDFVFYWGNDYYCNRHGKVVSS
jgi:hypothetical protein